MPKRYLVVSILSAVVLVLDQLTKLVVLAEYPLWHVKPVVPGLFNLVHFANRGAAFGFLNNPDTHWQRYLFMGVTFLAVGIIFQMVRKARNDEYFLLSGLGLVLGGAIGNLLDRIRLGYVVDFLDFYVNSYHWPAFNVADTAICIGAASLVFTFIGESRSASGTD